MENGHRTFDPKSTTVPSALIFSPSQEPCLHGGMCNSIDGAYECECGFGRWGQHCERLNPCLLTPGVGGLGGAGAEPCGPNTQACRNLSDTEYVCECKPGEARARRVSRNSEPHGVWSRLLISKYSCSGAFGPGFKLAMVRVGEM